MSGKRLAPHQDGELALPRSGEALARLGEHNLSR